MSGAHFLPTGVAQADLDPVSPQASSPVCPQLTSPQLGAGMDACQCGHRAPPVRRPVLLPPGSSFPPSASWLVCPLHVSVSCSRDHPLTDLLSLSNTQPATAASTTSQTPSSWRAAVSIGRALWAQGFHVLFIVSSLEPAAAPGMSLGPPPHLQTKDDRQTDRWQTDRVTHILLTTSVKA